MSDERRGYPSASGLHRIVECRGSWLAEQNLPETTVGAEDRDEGTLLHDLSEKGRITEGLDDDQLWAFKTAQSLKETFYEDYGVVGEVIKEQRLWAMAPDGSPLYSGKFDEAVIGEDFAVLVDYKFGRKEVPLAASNIQMLAYCVLLWLNYPEKQLYTAVIIQPRTDEENRLSAVSYTTTELQGAFKDFAEAISEAQTPDQPRNPSYGACEYCRALHACDKAFDFFTTILPS